MPLRKLLVADDSLTIQKVIRLALGQSSQSGNEGFDIQAVSDGKDAVQQIALQRPEIVLIDVSLPNKNAFEVKREVNQLEGLKDTRFILLSSAFESVDQDLYDATGFNGHLTKPFDPAHLRNVLSQTLAELDAMKSAETRLIQIQAPQVPPVQTQIKIEPEPLPPLPPIQVSPPVEDLWTSEEHLPDVPPAHLSSATDPSAGFVLEPPSFPEPPAKSKSNAPRNEREEIKLLMENTLGDLNTLDDLGWSMQEPKSRAVTTPRKENSLPASPPPLPPPPLLSRKEEPLFSLDAPAPASASTPTPQMPPEVVPLSSAQMEEIIERQLKVAIEKMAHKLLPDLAERILKDEIHKMLSEPLNGN